MMRLFLVLLCIVVTQQKTFYCDPHAPCGCSMNPASILKIVNGETAGVHTWSWATSLRIGRSLCGGAIISNSYILTAGHCVKGAIPSDITAYVSSNNVAQGQRRSVSRIYLHPQYYQDPFGGYVLNDIALLKLSTYLNMNDSTLAKICLPPNNVPLLDGSNVVAIGWGTLHEGDTAGSQTLQQVTLNVVDSTTSWCRSVAYNMTTQFCAGIMPDGGKGEYSF